MTDTFAPPATNPAYEYALRSNARNWEAEITTNPLARLLLADAYYARLQVEYDHGDLMAAHKMDELKRKAGTIIAEYDAATCRLALEDFTCNRFVRIVWPNGGIKRLEERANECRTRGI